jgi:glycosyltransferase involved in cell wall biosynthesis
MYNERENARDTLTAVADALREAGFDYELIPVSDGSTDGTADELAAIASEDPRVRPVAYATNRGRGNALRRGFEVARGDYVASLDADLSYTPDHVVRLAETLRDDPEVDVAIGSPYMPGGDVEGVSASRLAISKAGNVVLRYSLPEPIHTSTGILRAYRAPVLESLDLESDGKEIHLEILSKSIALGYRIVEVPSTLRSRKKGKSSFKLKSTASSHLLFSVLQRPAAIFGVIGVLLITIGIIIAGYLLGVYVTGALNPERPLMTLMVLVFLVGVLLLGFAIVAQQLLELQKDVVRLQGDVRRLRAEVGEDAAGGDGEA